MICPKCKTPMRKINGFTYKCPKCRHIEESNNDSEKPPSSKNNMGFSTRVVLTLSSLVQRPKNFRELWLDDWRLYPNRSPVFGRCLFVFENIPKK